MLGAVSHALSLTESDWTGTVTAFDSRASTLTTLATALARPSDWDSVHEGFLTLSGQTAGQSTLAGTNLVLAGGSGITLSAATAAGAATISVSDFVPPISRFIDFGAEGATLSSVTGGISSLSLRVFNNKYWASFSEVDIPVFVSLGTTKSSTAAVAISSAFVLYSVNASTLSPIVGVTGQTTYSWASNTAGFPNLTGARFMSFPVATLLPPGEYFAGFSFRTASSSVGASTFGASVSISMSLQQLFNGATLSTMAPHADFGAATAASTNSWFAGIYSNSISATNQTLAQSDFVVSVSQQFLANAPILFRNL